VAVASTPTKSPPMSRLLENSVRRCIFHALGACAASLALAALAAPLRADGAIPYFAQTPGTTVAGRPGDVSEASLKRSLTTPSAEGRWGDLPQFGHELFAPLTTPANPANAASAGGGATVPDAFLPPETGPVAPDY